MAVALLLGSRGACAAGLQGTGAQQMGSEQRARVFRSASCCDILQAVAGTGSSQLVHQQQVCVPFHSFCACSGLVLDHSPRQPSRKQQARVSFQSQCPPIPLQFVAAGAWCWTTARATPTCPSTWRTATSSTATSPWNTRRARCALRCAALCCAVLCAGAAMRPQVQHFLIFSPSGQRRLLLQLRGAAREAGGCGAGGGG